MKYEQEIKEAANASPSFDKVNAKQIASYFNEELSVVLFDISAARKYGL